MYHREQTKASTNPLTGAAQTAYAPDRPTLDVLTLIEIDVKQGAANQLILIDLSISRDIIGGIIRTALYEKGIPWAYIPSLQQGHKGTQLRPKIYGQLGKEVGSNRGASQGIPPIDQPFTIHFDAMPYYYANALHGEIKQTQPETYESNEFEERKMDNKLWGKPNINKNI